MAKVSLVFLCCLLWGYSSGGLQSMLNDNNTAMASTVETLMQTEITTQTPTSQASKTDDVTQHSVFSNSLSLNEHSLTHVTGISINVTNNPTEDAPPPSKRGTGGQTQNDLGAFIMKGVLAPIIMVIGTFSNILNMIVITGRPRWTSAYIYMFCLALCDLLHITMVWPIVFKQYQSIQNTLTFKSVYSYFLVYMYPASMTFDTAATWIIVAFTIERFIAVYRPLSAPRLCTPSKTTKIVVAIILICSGIHATRWFSRRIDYQTTPTGGYAKAVRTQFGLNKTWSSAYFWLACTVNMLIPFPLLAIMNHLIIYGMLKSQKKRNEMVKSAPSEKLTNKHTTRVLIAVVCTFFVCKICSAVLTIGAAFYAPIIYTWHWFKLLADVSSLLGLANSSVNFLLYHACSKEFRQATLNRCACLYCRRHETNSHTM